MKVKLRCFDDFQVDENDQLACMQAVNMHCNELLQSAESWKNYGRGTIEGVNEIIVVMRLLQKEIAALCSNDPEAMVNLKNGMKQIEEDAYKGIIREEKQEKTPVSAQLREALEMMSVLDPDDLQHVLLIINAYYSRKK